MGRLERCHGLRNDAQTSLIVGWDKLGQDRTNWDFCPSDKAKEEHWDMGHTPLPRRGVPCPSVPQWIAYVLALDEGLWINYSID